MRDINRLTVKALFLFLALTFCINLMAWNDQKETGDKTYKIFINRIGYDLQKFEEEKKRSPEDLQELMGFTGRMDYGQITGMFSIDSEEGGEEMKKFWENTGADYAVIATEHSYYKITYDSENQKEKLFLWVNGTASLLLAAVLCVILYIRIKILHPFHQFSQLPYQLAKGNLTVPLQENKNRFFGRFLWGMDLLREHLEEQKRRELELQKEKKLLLLSLSHDLKTPLSAIKLYARALGRNLYQEEEKKQEIAEHIKGDILLMQLCQYMRWIITVADGELCHVALHIYAEEPDEIRSIDLPIRPFRQYSSYEGIQEQRLFEKIKYEMEYNPKDSYTILIAGDILRKPLFHLWEMLDGWLGHSYTQTNRKPKLHFLIASQNKYDLNEQPPEFVSVENLSYDELFQGVDENGEWAALRERIHQCDVVMLLDCFQLYGTHYPVPYSSLKFLLGRPLSQSYRKVREKQASDHMQLSSENRFFEMRNLLIGAAWCPSLFSWTGEPALIQKDADMDFIDHLRKYLCEDSSGVQTGGFLRTAYCYLSDLRALEDLYWNEDFFVRLEQHAGKRFAILRLGRKYDNPLRPVENAQNRVIVFNFWQFIKHTSISQTELFLQYLGLKGYQDIYKLSDVLIGIDYQEWPNHVRLSYYYDEKNFPEDFKEKLNACIEGMVRPFFHPCEDIYQRYFRKCFLSLLYSDAKSVDDMLFLHLMKKQVIQFTNLTLELSGMNSRLPNLKSKKMKYSGKRFYQEVMSDYDVSAEFFPNQYRKLIQMQQSGDLSPGNVFRDIMSVCETNNYTGSYLY